MQKTEIDLGVGARRLPSVAFFMMPMLLARGNESRKPCIPLETPVIETTKQAQEKDAKKLIPLFKLAHSFHKHSFHSSFLLYHPYTVIPGHILGKHMPEYVEVNCKHYAP